MKNKILKSFLILLLIFLASCFKRWSEEEHEEFDAKCAKTKTFSHKVFHFRGFDNAEFDSVAIKEYHNGILLDTFKMFVWPASDDWHLNNKVRRGSTERAMNIDYEYHFDVNGKKFILKDMKMIKWAQYNMNSEGYGCVMAEYTINGVRYEHYANPTFQK